MMLQVGTVRLKKSTKGERSPDCHSIHCPGRHKLIRGDNVKALKGIGNSTFMF